MSWLLQYPWMLFWGLASLLPLILYRLRNRTRQRVPWAAMSFLREAPKVAATRKRFRRWLLLAVRVVLPLLIATLAATPGCLENRDGKQLNQNEQLNSNSTHWIFVFDTSASMGPRRSEDGSTSSNLQGAKRLAIQQIKQAKTNDTFSILTSGSHSSTRLFSQASAMETLSIVSSIQSGAGRFDWSEVFGELTRLQAIAPIANFETSRHRLVVFSDCQQTDWNETDWIESVRDSFIESLSQQIADVQIVDCSQPGSNAAVINMRSEPATAIVGRTIECKVQIRGQANQTVFVSIHQNDRQVGQQQATFDSEGFSMLTFPVAVSSGDAVRLETRIENDPSGLLADNQRYCVVPVRNHIRVTCFEQSRGLAERFATALQNEDTTLVPIDLTTEPVSRLGIRLASPDNCDVIGLFGCAAFDDEAIEKLLRFAEQGGSIIVSPAVDFLASKQLLNALQVGFDSTETVAGDFRLDPLGYRHPIVAGFANHPNAGVIDVPIARYHRINTTDLASNADIILNFDSGDPALFSVSRGKGNFIFATTPLTHEATVQQERWNELSAWWSFVPLVNESVKWAFGSGSLAEFIHVGDEWLPTSDVFGLSGELNVETPKGETVSIRPSQPMQVTVPGFWKTTTMPNHFLAVNIDSKESNLQVADLAEIRDWFSQALQANSDSSSDNASSNSNPTRFDASATRRLMILLAVFALALLIVEALLARATKQQPIPSSTTTGGFRNA